MISRSVLSLCCMVFVSTLYSMEIVEQTVNFPCNTIHDIPQFCIYIATRLSQQPLFRGRGIKEVTSVLSLPEWGDTQICQIMSGNAQDTLKKSNWPIFGVDCADNYRLTQDGHRISNAVELVQSENYQMYSLCPIQDLQVVYRQVIDSMRVGWAISDVEQHPKILFKESSDEWKLLVKEKTVCQEEVLIRCLLDKFNLHDDVNCHDYVRTGVSDRTLYLWVKNEKYTKMQEILDLVIQNNN